MHQYFYICKSYLLIRICLLVLLIEPNSIHGTTDKESQRDWYNLGVADIEAALKVEKITKRAKNVILFVGDGMGPTTITATRIYNRTEKGYLSFEKFPHVGILKTYSANKFVPDSSSTATALFCGTKANQKTSGVDATVALRDCTASLKPHAQLDSILTWAQRANKATGFVTTTRVTHATPSALYAHTPDRKWECDSRIPLTDRTKCQDIARQLIENLPGRHINVILGGGRQCLQSNVTGTVTDPIDTWSCQRQDGRDLIQTWLQDKTRRNLTKKYVSNRNQLLAIDPNSTEYLLGVFANGHMSYAYQQRPQPSLTEMTQTAISVLQSRDKDGYVLMVEGGLIDMAHHRGHANIALEEVAQFSNAIQMAIEMTSVQDTLIIVTSDHAHSLVFSGYAHRNVTHNVMGIAQASEQDGVPYTSLLYGTGGGNNFQYYSGTDGQIRRLDPSLNDTSDFEYSQQAAVLTDEVTHGGTDVAIYAQGPMAHLFTSVHEQTYVAYVISYAAKIGPLGNATFNSTGRTIQYHLIVTGICLIFSLTFD